MTQSMALSEKKISSYRNSVLGNFSSVEKAMG